MSDAYSWAQWWAFPWRHAHPDWQAPDVVAYEAGLTRNRHAALSKTFAIAPCLPCKPTASLVYLALARPSQHDRMLQLADNICRPLEPNQLDATQRLWCQRLAMSLHTQRWLKPTDDTLQLLRAWVAPHVWSRLRLRFAPCRIMAMEQIPAPDISAAKLQVLWQAVLWYEQTYNSDAGSTEVQLNAVTTHP